MSRPELVFVACVEPGRLEAQVVLLCRSIRCFAGRHRDARITVLQPRRSATLADATLAALADAGAELHRPPLNEEFPEYPIANKAFAAAWVERRAAEDVVVFVDSDSFFASEPSALAVGGTPVAAVRPVNAKNIGTAGPGDRNEPFWADLHARFGTRPPPTVQTTATGEAIHGYWNAGLVATRRDAGLMRRWRRILLRLLRARVTPPGGAVNHLDQVALTLALAPVETRVLDAAYNYPLTLRGRLPAPLAGRRLDELVHVHYFRSLHAPGYLDTLDPPLAADCRVAAWLRGHVPLTPVAFASEPRAIYRLDASSH